MHYSHIRTIIGLGFQNEINNSALINIFAEIRSLEAQCFCMGFYQLFLHEKILFSIF